jgi:hypothetical protein
VAPAGERLGADDPAGGDRHLGLEQYLDLVLVESPPQIDLELVAERAVARRAGVHHLDRPGLARLRFGESGAGAAEKAGGVFITFRSDDSDPAAQSDDVIARHERPADRLDQLAREEAALAEAGRGGEQDCELRAGDPGDEAAPAVRIGEPLDSPGRGLEDGVAGRPAEGGIDRVEAAHGQQQHDERGLPLPFGLELPLDPGACGSAVANPRHRIARLPGRALELDDRLRSPDHAFPVDPDMVGEPGAFAFPVLMGEGGRLAGGKQPVDRPARRLASVGIELSKQLHQADPLPGFLAEARPAGQRRAELDRLRSRLPAPRGASGPALLPFRLAPAKRAPAPDPLGVAVGILKRLEELGIAERADEEMGRAAGEERVERVGIASRKQDQQGGAIGLGGIGEASHRLLSFRQGAARVDHRHRGARGDETALGIVGPPGRDRQPPGPLRRRGQLVAVTEGQKEKRCARRGHASLSLFARPRFEPHRSTLGHSPQQSV